MIDIVSVKPRNSRPEALSKHGEISKLSENILSTLKYKSIMDINRPVFFFGHKVRAFVCKDDPIMPQNRFMVLPTTLPMTIEKRGKVEDR